MPDEHNQKAAFEFFKEHYRLQKQFTKQDVADTTSWSTASFNTYWSKQFKRLVVPVDNKYFRVSESFRPYSTWGAFRTLVTQVRRVSSDYTSLLYYQVIIYEFFMPLTNEGHLRTALDSLFYKDTILSRLRTLDQGRIQDHFPRKNGESEDDHFERLCNWIAGVFIGYSITHVSGRYRAEELSTIAVAAAFHEAGARYLVDETTAVVRFIFPCGDTRIRKPPLSSRHFEDDDQPVLVANEPSDARRIRWFFGTLFVQSIIQVVNGEDEIWMVESGMRNRLHIWRVDG